MASSQKAPKSLLAFWLATIFAIAIVSFGFYGFMQTYKEATGSWDFATVYGKTVELFRPVPVIFVKGEKVHEHWALTVAQALGRTFVVVAFIATVLAVFREYVAVILFQRASGHAIFVGLGHRGRDLALAKAKGIPLEKFIEQEKRNGSKKGQDSGASQIGSAVGGMVRQRVAAIELDGRKEGVEALQNAGALVLIGDGEDRSILWKTRISHAAQVFVLTGDDYTNLRVCEAILKERELSESPVTGLRKLVFAPWRALKKAVLWTSGIFGWNNQPPDLEVFVAVESHDLRAFLYERWGLITGLDERPEKTSKVLKRRPMVRVVGFQAIAVRSCISECFQRLALDERVLREGLQILIAGEREFILDVLRSAVVFAQISGSARPRICVMTPEALLPDYIRGRYPALEMVAEVSFVSNDPTAIGWTPQLKGLRFDACFLSWKDESITISGSNQLCGSSFCEASLVVAFVNGAPQARISVELPSQMRQVSVFETACKVIEKGFGDLEKKAMDQHFAYLKEQLSEEDRRTRESKEGSFEWDNLPEAKKESNRVAILHGDIKKAVWDSFQHADAEQQARILEHLSISEHGRWMAEKIMDGFVYGAENNHARRTHKDLRPWEALSEYDKDKDRKQVRKVLGLSGMALR